VEHDLVYRPGELPFAFTGMESQHHTIVFTGDIMTWDRTAPLIQSHGPDYPFHATEALIESADLAVGNLEGPVAVWAEKTTGDYRYKVPPFTLQGLRAAGFDLLGLANNHIMDCREAGLLETVSFLQHLRLGGFGAGRNLTEAARPAVARVGGRGWPLSEPSAPRLTSRTGRMPRTKASTNAMPVPCRTGWPQGTTALEP
jgi:poly-gamma-glutamate capsule biosynthesis protein CapA/YwtB (metallophosphatase superfamily)